MHLFVTGKYPCFCGLKDKKFRHNNLFNSEGVFYSLEERDRLINQTDTWKNGAQQGQLAVFETLQVCFLQTAIN